MSNVRNELFDKFKTGEMPNGEDFRMLIENSFNDNVEIYTKNGIQTKTVKIFVDETTVYNNNGEWTINFSNVNYNRVLVVLSYPIQQNQISDIKDAYLASVVHSASNTTAVGVAFNAAVQSYSDNDSGVSLAKAGTIIQVVVFGY